MKDRAAKRGFSGLSRVCPETLLSGRLIQSEIIDAP
jgi:hypothetical protein